MQYRRTPIEIESPEEMGYDSIECNLSESSIWDARLGDWSADLDHLILCYGEHRGSAQLRELDRHVFERWTCAPKMFWWFPERRPLSLSSTPRSWRRTPPLLVVRPNYATNISTPRLLRCSLKYLDLEIRKRL